MPNVTIRPDATTGCDGCMEESSPTTPNGTATSFLTGTVVSNSTTSLHGYLCFPMTGIPTGSTITAVEVGLNVEANAALVTLDYRLYRVVGGAVDFVLHENDTTWQDRYRAEPWADGGGTLDPSLFAEFAVQAGNSFPLVVDESDDPALIDLFQDALDSRQGQVAFSAGAGDAIPAEAAFILRRTIEAADNSVLTISACSHATESLRPYATIEYSAQSAKRQDMMLLKIG